MRSKTDQIIKTLNNYATGRQNDVVNGLESTELSSLLVEKYAVGLVDAIRTLGVDVDSNKVTTAADELCLKIDPDLVENRKARYKSFSKLKLSKRKSQIKNFQVERTEWLKLNSLRAITTFFVFSYVFYALKILPVFSDFKQKIYLSDNNWVAYALLSSLFFLCLSFFTSYPKKPD